MELTTATRERRGALVVVAAVVVAVLALTLWPSRDLTVHATCPLCADGWAADGIANILLFVPFGAALAYAGPRRVPPWLAALLLSTIIEATQAWVIPGRDGSAADILTNGLGGALGALAVDAAASWIRPRAWRAVWAAAALGVLAVVTATGMLARPALPKSIYWGQWAARFGNMAWYEGRVTTATLGDAEIPDGRLARSARAREALLRGEPLEARFIAGPPPAALAPIISIADDAHRTIVLVGAEGTTAELRVRRFAGALRLRQPHIVVDGAFDALVAGRPAEVSVRREAPAWCLRVDARRWCRVGVSVGGGWRLIASGNSLPVSTGRVLDAAWVLALGVVAAFWAAGRAGTIGSVAVLVLACGVLPRAVGLDPTGWHEWAAAVAGLWLGGTGRRSLGSQGRSAGVPDSAPSVA